MGIQPQYHMTCNVCGNQHWQHIKYEVTDIDQGLRDLVAAGWELAFDEGHDAWGNPVSLICHECLPRRHWEHYRIRSDNTTMEGECGDGGP